MKIVNLTPHRISVENNGEILLVLEKCEQPCRVRSDCPAVGKIEGVPIYKEKVNQIVRLPPKIKGIVYIVSGIVAGEVQRDDLFIPYDKVKDDFGDVIYCRGFKCSEKDRIITEYNNGNNGIDEDTIS